MEIFQTPLFARQKKKLKKNQSKELNKAVEAIIKNPEAGTKKHSDLAHLWVYKFKIINQLYLLAYEWDETSRVLIALGVHENFYRDLKKRK